MKIYDYMAARAKSEGMKHTLPRQLYKQWLNQGFRCFFGVLVDDIGTPISDSQNPAFFEEWEFLTRSASPEQEGMGQSQSQDFSFHHYMETTMNQQVDWSDSAVDFAEGYLENDGGEIIEISAETRTMAMTIIVLSRHIQSMGESADPVKRQLLLDLLEQFEEQRLIDACQFFLTAVAQCREVVKVTPSPVRVVADGSDK